MNKNYIKGRKIYIYNYKYMEDDITMNQITRILAKYLENNIIESSGQRYRAIGYLYDVLSQKTFIPIGDNRIYKLIKITIDNSENNSICLITLVEIMGSNIFLKIIIKEKEDINKLNIYIIIEENTNNLENICEYKIIELVKDDVLQKMEDIKMDAEQKIEDIWKSINVKNDAERDLTDISQRNISNIMEQIKNKN